MTFEIELWQVGLFIGIASYLVGAYGCYQLLKFVHDSRLKCAVYGLFWPVGLAREIYQGIKEEVDEPCDEPDAEDEDDTRRMRLTNWRDRNRSTFDPDR